MKHIFAVVTAVLFARTSLADFVHQKVLIGKWQTRAVWTDTSSSTRKIPAVILIPGTGAQDPGEMMRGNQTADGKDHPLLDEFSLPLNQAGISTLELGKPGVEYFSGWNAAT